MHWLVADIWSVGIAIGPVLGYVYQYNLIDKKKTVGTFSIKLCGLLLFCNILRIGFYLFVQYSLALFIQSIFMIIVQLLLLRLCVNTMIQEGTLSNQQQGSSLTKNFWRWDSLPKYYYAIGTFSIGVLFFSLVFSRLKVALIGQLIGYLSLVSESLLMLPQVIQNMKQQRVKGLSHLLVGLNNVGDLMKLGFFIVNNQPTQFLVCGILQCFIDGFVIFQICYYKKEAPTIQQEHPQSEQINNKPSGDKDTNGEKKTSQEYKEFQDQN